MITNIVLLNYDHSTTDLKQFLKSFWHMFCMFQNSTFKTLYFYEKNLFTPI